MPFNGIEEKEIPWLKDLDKDTLEAIQGQIFPAQTIVCCDNGYLIETNLFKVWLFEGSASFHVCKTWETSVPITKTPQTPSIQVKRTAKNGFVFGIDTDNLCSVQLRGQAYYLTPPPPPSKSTSKRQSDG